MFFVVRSKDSFNFPLGLIKYIVILIVVTAAVFVFSLSDCFWHQCVSSVSTVFMPMVAMFEFSYWTTFGLVSCSCFRMVCFAAKYRLELSSVVFLIRFLAAFMAFSAFPLDCGYFGELVTCWKPQVVTKPSELLDWNGGPLSETTSSPCRAKWALSL